MKPLQKVNFAMSNFYKDVFQLKNTSVQHFPLSIRCVLIPTTTNKLCVFVVETQWNSSLN